MSERFAFDLPPGAGALLREWPGFASPAECAALCAQHARWLPAEPTGEGAHGRVRADTVRAREPAPIEAVTDRILATLRRAHARDDLVLDYAVLVRFATGQFHALHADDAVYDCPHGGSAVHRWGREDCAEGRWRPLPGSAHRELSAFLFLDEDGAGGELYFAQHALVVPPRTGLLVTYPSNRCFLHEVLPVAAGARHVLQAWAARR